MASKVIALYPGRFQPFSGHHYKAYQWLAQKFGPQNTYIVTSNKVEPIKSPLNFDEKKRIMVKHGVPEGNIVMAKNVYAPQELLQNMDPDTSVVFMVGSKDMSDDPRFTVGKKKDGSPTYFQKYDGKNMEGFAKHGYLIIAPHVSMDIKGVGEMSGTNVRKALSNPKSDKEQFKSIFGWYDPEIEKMLKSKFGAVSESIANLLENRAISRLILLEMLMEGGNAIPSSIPVDKDDVKKVVAAVKSAMPKELSSKVQTDIGSSGYKVQSGDIDIFLDEDAVIEFFGAKDANEAKKALKSYFEKQGLPSVIKGRNVHVGVPYKDQKAQVDVMVIKDSSTVAPWHQHGPRGAYSDPEFKGSDLFILMNSIGKALGYKFDAFGANLVRRDDNRVVARDRDKVAKILLNKNATGEDLNSVKTVLKALENDPKRDEKLAQAKEDEKKGLIRLNFGLQEQILSEADGARIQHPEDLIYWDGSKGAKKALQALQNIDPKQVSVKWDGAPAVVFGYDENGNFIFTDKAAFSAKGYDGKAKSSQELSKMIVDRGARSGKDYSEFGQKMAGLFDLAKKATPKKKGFYYGDMLYFTKPKQESGNFVFQPNVVKYSIPLNTELGKKISNSEAGIVVHYFMTPTGETEKVGENDFPSNSRLLVMPPTFAQTPPNPSKELVSKASSTVSKASSADKLLDKGTLSSQKMTDLPDILYNYTNNRVEDINKLSASDFLSFLSSNTKISGTKKQKVEDYVKQNSAEFDNVFNVVKSIAELKNNLVSQLDSTSGDVTATINGKPGGEGYVINSGGDKIKLVNRGGFTAANKAVQR